MSKGNRRVSRHREIVQARKALREGRYTDLIPTGTEGLLYLLDPETKQSNSHPGPDLETFYSWVGNKSAFYNRFAKTPL